MNQIDARTKTFGCIMLTLKKMNKTQTTLAQRTTKTTITTIKSFQKQKRITQNNTS